MLYDNRLKLCSALSLVGASSYTTDVLDVGGGSAPSVGSSSPLYLKIAFPTAAVASVDESLVFVLQTSASSTFDSGIVEVLRIGDSTGGVSTVNFSPTRYSLVLPLPPGLAFYRYMRLKVIIVSPTATATAAIIAGIAAGPDDTAVATAAAVTALSSAAAGAGTLSAGTLSAFISSDPGPSEIKNIADTVN